MNNCKQRLEIGKIVKAHGLKGEVKVMPWCDSPEILCDFDEVFLKNGEVLKVRSSRVVKGMALMKFSGIDTIEQAEKLVNTVLYADREDFVLEDGVYFIQDLIGITVKESATGKIYGEITDVLQTGANDVYVVKGNKSENKELLIPAIADVVISTDIGAKTMLVAVAGTGLEEI
jgi:16S rRNA processing protein RimM